MSARSLVGSDLATREFDAGRLGRLTWVGLVVAAIGWALLLGAAVLVQRMAAKVGAADMVGFHADLLEMARCLIGSGFALALIGALQTGFGALNRFFAAVLTRSASRTTSADTASADATSTSMPVPTVDRAVATLRERRPYTIMADGSVEVETIVGTRRFGSMEEARDFI